MTLRIAVVGGGVMGRTLAAGFLRRDPAPEVVIAERRTDVARDLRTQLGVRTGDAAEIVGGSRVVLLAVKPQDVDDVLAQIAPAVSAGTLVISIAAGVRTERIEQALTGGVAVVRAMPNTPARVALAVTGISAGAGCDPASVALARDLLGSIGTVVDVPEPLQDAVTAVSGSGPAYVFYLAEAMTAAGLELGLDLPTATALVNQTILGAATLLVESGESAADLRHQVTSPAGTTAAAIGALDTADAGATIRAAVVAARDRSRELSGG